MSRPKRIDLPFCVYHVMSRTNTDGRAFLDQRDYAKFLEYLAEYSDMYSYNIHAYCLMPNHFHLLIESKGRPALSDLMHRLLTAYTVYFNRRHQRHGHLFQGRFKSLVVDKTDYLLAVSRYIHLNMSRKNNPAYAEKYTWSSLRHYLQGNEPKFLYTKEILAWFKGNRKKYGRFIRQGLEKDIEIQVMNQRYVGKETFARRIRRRISFLGKKGTKERKAAWKRDEQTQRMEESLAKNLVRRVAKYFKCSPEMIVKGRWAHGDIGNARTILVALLRAKLPWSCSKIGTFMGISQKAGIGYYLRRVKKDKDLEKIYNVLKEKSKR